jgi:hypothetical protein
MPSKKWNSRRLPSPLRPFLNGKKVVLVDAQLEARDGSLNYTLKTEYHVVKITHPAAFRVEAHEL